MFFKKKCPLCGFRNPKENMTCIECGAPLDFKQTERQVSDLPAETMAGADRLLERDIFVQAAMNMACPECSSKNAQDCKNNPLLEDETIGHCLDCGIYWCLDCGYIFELVEEGMECPHWEICGDCSDEHGYLDQLEFMETICSTCEHYDDGCQLEDTLRCNKRGQLLCPYEGDVSNCPQVTEVASTGDSSTIGSEYIKYIPGKCAYCGSSNVSETLKRTIKGTVVNGYLWDTGCADCGSKWVALEKPDYQ